MAVPGGRETMAAKARSRAATVERRSAVGRGPEHADPEYADDLLYQPAVDPYAAGATLDALGRRRQEALRAGLGIAVVAGLLAVAGARTLVLPVLAGAAASWFIALCAAARRRALIRLLLRQRSAYVLPEVAEAGGRLATREARLEVASLLTRVVDDPAMSEQTDLPFLLPRRVARHADELRAIACLLADETAAVHPSTIALILRLLEQPQASPLYNPDVPEEHLAMLLRRVCASIDAAGARRSNVSPTEPDGRPGTERRVA